MTLSYHVHSSKMGIRESELQRRERCALTHPLRSGDLLGLEEDALRKEWGTQPYRLESMT